MDITPELKVLLDMGLGGLSIMLWIRQGKVNRQQMLLDQNQTKATEDLTLMVRDHDTRLAKLERRRGLRTKKGK